MYKRPKISLIIPVYNVEPYLADCLQSVCRQTFQDLEVLVVNDGSTDQSSQIINRFKAQNSHFICIEQANGGIVAARRAGLLRAEGETVCFLDGDDFISPLFLEELLRAKETANADLSVGRTARYFEKENRTDYPSEALFKHRVLTKDERVKLLGQCAQSLSLCGKLFKLEEVRRLTFPEHKAAEDILPAVQAIASARRISLAQNAVYFYRQNRAGSLSHVIEGKFTGLWMAFEQAQQFLQQQKKDSALAFAFQSVRWTCLLSHISKWGLTAKEWALMKGKKEVILNVPAACFKGQPWRTQVQFNLLKMALRCGFSYPSVLQKTQKFVDRPLKKLLKRLPDFDRAKEQK